VAPGRRPTDAWLVSCRVNIDLIVASRTGTASRRDEGSNVRSFGGGATPRMVTLGRNPLGRRGLASGSLSFVGHDETAPLPLHFMIPPTNTRLQTYRY
jgi:hypothetical protein